MATESLAPVLRVGNAAEAITWYQRLGFALQVEHSWGTRFDRTEAVLTRGGIHLIISEGVEDVPPEGLVVLQVTDLAPIEREFGIQARKAFLCEQIELRDPYGNRIRVVTLDRFVVPSAREEGEP